MPFAHYTGIGRGIGSRYDGSYPGSSRVGSCNGLTGKASSFSSSYKTFLRKYWEAQIVTYEKAAGWIQWTWKAEEADEWTYQAGLANGWIPKVLFCSPVHCRALLTRIGYRILPTWFTTCALKRITTETNTILFCYLN